MRFMKGNDGLFLRIAVPYVIVGITAGYPESFGPMAGIGAIVARASMLPFAAIVCLRVPFTRSGERKVTPFRHDPMGSAP
jgi:hypothetical protein